MVTVRNHTIYEYIAAPKSSLRNIDGENGNEREKEEKSKVRLPEHKQHCTAAFGWRLGSWRRCPVAYRLQFW